MKIVTILLFLSFFCISNAQTVYLYTPNGSSVEAFERQELSASDIAYYTNDCAYLYPNAEILAPASLTYNCHSYAWNMIEGGQTCWLNQDPDLHLYWDDGSYDEVAEIDAVKIFYYLGDHSAVKSTTHSGKYESKWGTYPLVRHSPDYGPSIYNMQYRKYYRSGGGSGCVSDFSNRTVTVNTTITGCSTLTVQNVTVTGGAKLTIISGGDVTFSNFEVTPGSEFEIQ